MLTNSETESITYFTNRKRTVFRGFIAGLMGYFFISICMTFAVYAIQSLLSLFLPDGHALTKFIASETAQTGSLLISTFALFIGIFSGIFVGMWSPQGSRIVVAGLTAMSLASIFVSPIPDGLSLAKLTFWMLATPVGYILGNELYLRHELQIDSSKNQSKS
jgi:hypothetical protein